MADILKKLLKAYEKDIELQRSDTLSYIASTSLIQSPELLPPDLSSPLPIILIYPAPIPVKPACLPGRADIKTYTIGLTIAIESYRDETLGLFGSINNIGIIDAMNDLENLYRRETFDLSCAAWTTLIDYTIRRYPPFMGEAIAQGHLSIEHTYWDDGS